MEFQLNKISAISFERWRHYIQNLTNNGDTIFIILQTYSKYLKLLVKKVTHDIPYVFKILN